MTKTKKRGLRIFVSALIIILSLLFLQRLLTPKYVDDVVEGAFIKEFYNEEHKQDLNLIFIGDCEVYSNFSPVTLWQEYGINSYIRGSADQYVWQSYYILEDTLKYVKPEAVVFNVLSLRNEQPKREAYNRMSLEGLKWSGTKIRAIQDSMMEDEHFLDYVFPILRYHSRWSDIKSTDFRFFFRSKPVTYNGFYLKTDVRPPQDVPEGKPLSNYEFSEKAWSYLDGIRSLCEENGIELILVKAPSLYPYWYDEYEQQVEAYANEHQLTYINFLEHRDEIGLDYNSDTFDGGLHLNVSGAEKLSRWFGNILSENGLSDLRDREYLSQMWDEEISRYEQKKAEQSD